MSRSYKHTTTQNTRISYGVIQMLAVMWFLWFVYWIRGHSFGLVCFQVYPWKEEGLITRSIHPSTMRFSLSFGPPLTSIHMQSSSVPLVLIAVIVFKGLGGWRVGGMRRPWEQLNMWRAPVASCPSSLYCRFSFFLSSLNNLRWWSTRPVYAHVRKHSSSVAVWLRTGHWGGLMFVSTCLSPLAYLSSVRKTRGTLERQCLLL